LLLRLDHRDADPHRVRARQPQAAEAETALRSARGADGTADPRVPRRARVRTGRRYQTAPMTGFAREREVAVAAARAGGAVVRRYYGTDVAVERKGPDSPVTQADLEANARIRELVTAAFPDDGWLYEETADSPERLRRKRVWVVDPLDGTKEFVAR